MNHGPAAKAPFHLWIVGILSLLWNGFGCTDYVMIRMRNIEWLSQTPGVDPQTMLAWVDSFPVWANLGWALGVWGGLIGSILLLLRHRWAVPAFGLSLVGAVMGLGYQFFGSPPPAPLDQGFMRYMPLVIILITAALYYYASRQRQGGVLR